MARRGNSSNFEHRYSGPSQKSPKKGFPKTLIFMLVFSVLVIIVWIAVPPLTKHKDWSFISGDRATTDIGLLNAPSSLNIRSQDNPEAARILVGNVYQGLTARNDKNEVVPALATSWTISQDGKQYTFHLRQANFSNGDKFTSDDVLWSFEQLEKNHYQGYDLLGNLAGVHAPNPSTVVMQFSKPDPSFLWRLSTVPGMIFDAKHPDSAGLSDNPIGTGPYTISATSTGQPFTELQLKRNNNYWGDKTHFSDIVLKYFKTPQEMFSQLRQNRVQSALGLTGQEIKDFPKDAPANLSIVPTTTVATLAFNSSTNSLMSDRRMRRVVRMAVTRQNVINAVGGLGTPTAGPITPLDPGYQNLTSLYPTNVPEARRLKTYFIPPAPYTIAYPNGTPKAAVDEIVREIRNAGVPVADPVHLDPQQWKAQIEDGMKFDMAFFYHHGSHNLGYWMTGRGWWTQDSPVADELYRKAMTASTKEAYDNGLAQAAKVLVDVQPADWIYDVKVANAWNKTLSGMPTAMTDDWLPLGNLK